mmetsp:Transcript_1004/g.1957  ORF Transcript_1004/g.1957 Transcript_1004/m.1957 type:complete len:155 (-) Transcript_1004:5-469(-)
MHSAKVIVMNSEDPTRGNAGGSKSTPVAVAAAALRDITDTIGPQQQRQNQHQSSAFLPEPFPTAARANSKCHFHDAFGESDSHEFGRPYAGKRRRQQIHTSGGCGSCTTRHYRYHRAAAAASKSTPIIRIPPRALPHRGTGEFQMPFPRCIRRK